MSYMVDEKCCRPLKVEHCRRVKRHDSDTAKERCQPEASTCPRCHVSPCINMLNTAKQMEIVLWHITHCNREMESKGK